MTATPSPIQPRHLKADAAAAYIGISRASLDRLRVAGLIGSYVEGRSRFYDRAELDRYCDSRTYEPPTRGDGLTHIHLQRRAS